MFVRLLQAVYRLSQVGWLQPQQRHWVDTCVQTLAEVGTSCWTMTGHSGMVF